MIRFCVYCQALGMANQIICEKCKQNTTCHHEDCKNPAKYVVGRDHLVCLFHIEQLKQLTQVKLENM